MKEKATESRQVYESYLNRLQSDRERAQTLNEHKLMQVSNIQTIMLC